MFNASCIIIVPETRKLDNINKETIINYQAGRLKRIFKRVNIVFDSKQPPKYLDGQVYFNRFKRFKNFGRILSAFSKIRTNNNIFLNYELIDFGVEDIKKIIQSIKDYMLALPLINNEISFLYGGINKKNLPLIKSFIYDKKIKTEEELLKKLKVNFFKI